jgi:hypothetical protein
MPANKSTILSFQEASDILGNRSEKKLSGNTYLFRQGKDEFVIRFHGTNIVSIFRDGTYSLNTNGYRTFTTKSRLNEFSPASVSQNDFAWYLHTADGVIPFEDGVRVDRNGCVLK